MSDQPVNSEALIRTALEFGQMRGGWTAEQCWAAWQEQSRDDDTLPLQGAPGIARSLPETDATTELIALREEHARLQEQLARAKRNHLDANERYVFANGRADALQSQLTALQEALHGLVEDLMSGSFAERHRPHALDSETCTVIADALAALRGPK
jgi:hypothetical protein